MATADEPGERGRGGSKRAVNRILEDPCPGARSKSRCGAETTSSARHSAGTSDRTGPGNRDSRILGWAAAICRQPPRPRRATAKPSRGFAALGADTRIVNRSSHRREGARCNGHRSVRGGGLSAHQDAVAPGRRGGIPIGCGPRPTPRRSHRPAASVAQSAADSRRPRRTSARAKARAARPPPPPPATLADRQGRSRPRVRSPRGPEDRWLRPRARPAPAPCAVPCGRAAAPTSPRTRARRWRDERGRDRRPDRGCLGPRSTADSPCAGLRPDAPSRSRERGAAGGPRGRR